MHKNFMSKTGMSPQLISFYKPYPDMLLSNIDSPELLFIFYLHCKTLFVFWLGYFLWYLPNIMCAKILVK